MSSRSAWGPRRCSISRRIISTSTAASRSPAATIRPITTASRCCSKAARSSARRSRSSASALPSGDWDEGAGTIEEVDIREAYVDRLLQDFSGKAVPHRLGRRQRRRRSDPRHARRTAARPASRDLHRGRRHLPQPSSRPDRRGQPRRPQGAGRREGARLRHRLRRRRRPHRRGRRRGPRDLGRPAAADPRRARC